MAKAIKTFELKYVDYKYLHVLLERIQLSHLYCKNIKCLNFTFKAHYPVTLSQHWLPTEIILIYGGISYGTFHCIIILFDYWYFRFWCKEQDSLPPFILWNSTLIVIRWARPLLSPCTFCTMCFVFCGGVTSKLYEPRVSCFPPVHCRCVNCSIVINHSCDSSWVFFYPPRNHPAPNEQRSSTRRYPPCSGPMISSPLSQNRDNGKHCSVDLTPKVRAARCSETATYLRQQYQSGTWERRSQPSTILAHR